MVKEAHEALVAELGVRAAGHTGMDKCGISMLHIAYVECTARSSTARPFLCTESGATQRWSSFIRVSLLWDATL